jgi:hypothetical protein
MTKREFYKTVFTVTVLSEEPLNEPDLSDLHHMITVGDCSGVVKQTSARVLNGLQAAQALQEQGSDPEFFQITEEGEDVSDE